MIVTNCERLYCRLNDLKVCAEQERPFSGDVLIEVPKTNGRYVIVEGDETLISSADAEWVTLYVNEMVNFRLSHQMKDYVKIHAACGSVDGRRFLLVGEKGAGKTTLITRLLFDGIAVHGDERVLVRGPEVIPIPRRFHLKEGTIPLVPELASICKSLASYPGYGVRTYYFAPSDAGVEWQIRWGNVDSIFYLLPNHRGESRTEICPRWQMAQNLILRSSDFEANPEGQMSDLFSLINRSNNFFIHIGELSGAVRVIREILS